MAGRTSVNKRQRELVRKERQAEKRSRRDERRVKRGAGNAEEPLVTAPQELEGPSRSLPGGESPDVK